MEAQQITFALIDHSGGFEATPDRVRLGDLADFSADVAVFLRGNDKEIDTKTLEVAVVKGSVAIQTAPVPFAPLLFKDLSCLLGGITKANAHVRLPDGSTIKVITERDVLRNDTVNRLYKMAMLRIKTEYNVQTRDLRNARLIEFVEYSSQVDEEALARMTRRGTTAWKDVSNATAWVDEQRGGVH